jgi:uncharacterized lipoprotein YmbA
MNIRYALPLLALSVIQMGCSLGGPSRPSQFYTLSVSEGAPVAGRAVATPLSVALGPLSLPDILDRPQIVTRPHPNRLELAEFDRWGGDLDKDLLRVLTQDMMTRLNTDSIVAYPWQGSDRPDYQVSMRFFSLDGQLDERAYLAGIWELLDGALGCRLATQRFDISETTVGSGYPAFVQAMSEGLAELSQQIAVAVAQARPGCE